MGKSNFYCNRSIRSPQGSNYQFALTGLSATIAGTGVDGDCWREVPQADSRLRREPDSCPRRATSSALPLYSPNVGSPVERHHI